MAKVLVYDPLVRRRKHVWVDQATLKLIQQMRAEKGLPPVIEVEVKTDAVKG